MKNIKTLALLALAVNLSLFGGRVSTLGKEISTLAKSIYSNIDIRIPEYTLFPCEESAAELDNPYIGWYQIHTYTLSDGPSNDLAPILEQDYGPGLVLLQFNLRNFSQVPVSEAGLRQLSDILDAWHSRGRQLILRFLYDWENRPEETEPDSLEQILEHMSQTAEVVNLHRDCVHIIQGIYVGSWGEMHGSRYANPQDMVTLISHLASVTDPSIFLAVRTPGQWRAVMDACQAGAPEGICHGSLPARLGLYNDGLLGSETDLGTYGESNPGASAGESSPRASEIQFQNSLCNQVPNGGEVVIDNPYNDFPSAVQDLAAIHVSYLNDAYDQAVLSKWQADSYAGEGPFRGMNGYDYIARHLGYRYVLKSSSLSLPAPGEDSAVLCLALGNTGFSASYRDFDVTLRWEHPSGQEEHVQQVDADTRSWLPGQEILLEIPLEPPSLDVGEHRFYLAVKDPRSGFEILLSNEGAQEGHGCPVGYVSIRKFPQ